MSPNIERVVSIYRALAQRDLVALSHHIAPDVVLRIEGNSRFAGRYAGWGAVIALAARFEQRLIPFASQLEDVVEDGASVRATVTVGIVAAPKDPKDVFWARLFETFGFGEDGLVHDLAIEAEDQDAVDRFLGVPS